MNKKIIIIKQLPFIISIIAILSIVFDLGFDHKPVEQKFLQLIYLIALFVGVGSVSFRYFFKKTRPKINVMPFDFLLVLFILVLIFIELEFLIENNFTFLLFLNARIWVYLALILIFIRELASSSFDFRRMTLNPAQLFILSFLFIILVGTGMLLLPRATYTSISVIDALFTSTSAVCVTGLVVVDTGSFFTPFGQMTILMLIQLGGLGIMTFTSYFSYFFKAGSSYENQMLLSAMTNTEKIGEVFSTLKRIIIITFIIEAFGALFVFMSLDTAILSSFTDRLFFSVFHSISGFCNAGFSTLQNSFYEPAYRFNYPLHIIIAFLIILGGIGFPIVFNLLSYIKNNLKNLFYNFTESHERIRMHRIINVNTRLVLVTSILLTVGGTLLFYIFEYNHTLAEHGFWGKIVTAFFGSVTTRTAGFNTVDTSALNVPTLMLVLFLMWVGASPGSTGGGIKTSTLAIAVLNFINMAKGKEKIEVYKREIAQKSVNRAFAIITLSILVIFLSIFGVSMFDRDKGLLNISFECVSAFGTVGLSRGITATLSNPGKLIIIITMFIGRVSMLTIFIAVFRKLAQHEYRYPSEEVLIN
ncbi:MAG: TrkH family potassium uptake protein [Paludibacter sp.]